MQRLYHWSVTAVVSMFACVPRTNFPGYATGHGRIRTVADRSKRCVLSKADLSLRRRGLVSRARNTAQFE